MGITANATYQDPDSEEIYFFYTNAWVRKLTPGRSLGGSWSANLNRTFLPDSFDEAASAYDTTRDRIFLVRPGTSLRYTFDPRSGTFTQVLLSGAGLGGFSALANKGVGMVYVPATDSYYVRGNGAGGTTYQIRADTFEVTVLPTTGGAAQPGPPAVAANNYAHVYNRWLLVPALGGIVFFPTSSTNAWFLRTH